MKKSYTLLLLLIAFLANAQTYPFIENFETGFSQYNAINTQNGYSSDISVYPRGISATWCAQAQMSQFNHRDTLVTPLIGPLTANTEAYFYFRVVSYIGSVAASYTLAGNENIVVQVGSQQLNFYNTVYTITSSNQNSGTTFLKVPVNVSAYAGQSGNVKFITTAPGTTDWYFHLDSIVVREAGSISSPPVVQGSVTNLLCNGVCTGAINLTVTGGTQPYSYIWNSGNGTSLCAGSYSVTVTDGASQTASASFNVTEPSVLSAASAISPVTCFGACNGIISLFPGGGTPGYTFIWSNGATTDSTSTLCAGTYNCTITDANNCSIIEPNTVSEPSELMSSANSDTILTGGNITVSATGGTPAYTITWSDAGNGFNRTFASTGTYYCTVCDNHNCCKSDTVVVKQTTAVEELNESSINVYPSLTNDLMWVSGTTTGTIFIYDQTGRLIMQQNVSQGIQMVSLQQLPPAIYLIEVKTENRIKRSKIVKQ